MLIKRCFTVLQGVTPCYRVIPTRCYTGLLRMLEGVTRCYTLLQSVLRGYTMLQGATKSYTTLKGVTLCNTVLHGVRRVVTFGISRLGGSLLSIAMGVVKGLRR